MTREQPNTRFWILWVVVTTLGWTLGAVLYFMFGLFGYGIPVAIGQAVLLRGHIKYPWLWIAATISGVIVGGYIVDAILPALLNPSNRSPNYLEEIRNGTMFGFFIGFLQLFALREKKWRASIWVLGMTVSGAIGRAFIIMSWPTPMAYFIEALITATVMLWLLRSSWLDTSNVSESPSRSM